jgi:hypothetical protein
MKLDVNVLRYLSKEDFRVLTSVEMGQKNVCGKQDMQVQQHSGLCKLLLLTCTPCTVLLLQHELVPMQLIDTISGLK